MENACVTGQKVLMWYFNKKGDNEMLTMKEDIHIYHKLCYFPQWKNMRV